MMAGNIGALALSVPLAVLGVKLTGGQSRLGLGVTVGGALAYSCAVATASAANVYMMRRHELKNGIEVYDTTGKIYYGKSKVAAKHSVRDTAISRAMIPFPAMILPVLVKRGMDWLTLWPRSVPAGRFIELALCLGFFNLAVPMCLAIYPQRCKLTREQMDEGLRELKPTKFDVSLGLTKKTEDSKEEPEFVEEFHYNRGV